MLVATVGRTHVDPRTREVFDVDNQKWELDVDGHRFGPYTSQQHCASAYRKMCSGLAETASVRVYRNDVFHHVIR